MLDSRPSTRHPPGVWLLLACAPDPCVRFVGDVSLSRGVAEEISRRGSPWGDARGPWVGNLEGTLAQGACSAPICLGITPTTLEILRGGPFAALSVANNHSYDYGAEAHADTSAALRGLGIAPLEDGVATDLTLAGREWSFVAVDLTGTVRPAAEAPHVLGEGFAFTKAFARAPQATQSPTSSGVLLTPARALEQARLAVARARAHTPWVVTLPHWGIEGVAAPGPGQETTARILQSWGSTLVIGSGAHVPQPESCTEAGAVYYGLGNYLFDQVPPATHTGRLVACCPTRAGLECRSSATHRDARSTFPIVESRSASTCHISTSPVDRAWEAHPWRDHFRSVQAFREVNGWFTLHDHWSDLDREVGLRPYVFRMNADGSFTDVWRGSSLARPLVAALLFEWRDDQLLCAIHRGDSFLAPDPATHERVRLVYRWNGFGFTAVDDPGAMDVCDGL